MSDISDLVKPINGSVEATYITAKINSHLADLVAGGKVQKARKMLNRFLQTR